MIRPTKEELVYLIDLFYKYQDFIEDVVYQRALKLADIYEYHFSHKTIEYYDDRIEFQIYDTDGDSNTAYISIDDIFLSDEEFKERLDDVKFQRSIKMKQRQQEAEQRTEQYERAQYEKLKAKFQNKENSQ